MDLSSLSDQALSLMVTYGAPAVFVLIFAASLGLPLPASLALIVAGTFVAQGQYDFWLIGGVALAAALLGDNGGYAAGRWSGARLQRPLQRWLGGPERFAQAEQATRRWGGAAVFLSRWLLTPIGPTLNFTSGLTQYPWLRFLVCDLVGELIWVGGYLTLGQLFSTQVDTLSNLLSDISSSALIVVVVGVLGWLLVRSFRQSRAAVVEPTTVTPPSAITVDERPTSQ